MNDVDKKLLELSKTNLSWAEIGKILGLTPSAIWWRIRKYNLNRKSKKLSKEIENKIVELVLQNRTRKEISKELKIHINTVSAYVHKNNLKFKGNEKVKYYKDVILNMLEDNKSMSDICAATKLSIAVIDTFLKKNGYDSYRKRIRKINTKNVLQLHNSGLLVNEIAAQLNIHTATVRSILNELNIPENKNKLYKLNIDELDPYEYYISQNIVNIPEEDRKKFIINVIKAHINKTQSFVSMNDIINLPCGITRYYIDKYKISIPQINLDYGLTKSQSIFEQCIANYLIRYNYNFEIQKTFSILKSPKGNLLRFDFYLRDQNILIEADGNQHWNIKSKWYHKRIIEYDKLKTEWCFNNNIKLIRIPYHRNPSDNYIEKYINS